MAKSRPKPPGQTERIAEQLGNKPLPEYAIKSFEIMLKAAKMSPQRVEEMAQLGISMADICKLFDMSEHDIIDDPDLHKAFHKGRANIASKIRVSILKDALENDNLQAKLYLDKTIGGDKEKSQNVNVSVTRPLEQISTDQLLNVTLKKDE